MTIKKTVTIEGVRSWTGPMENYEAHKEGVEHWCGGGDIETHDDATDWYDVDANRPLFAPSFEYRIKRREPRFGEVWVVGDIPCIYSKYGLGGFRFIQLDDANAHSLHANPVYSAPSVEAYIAKQIIQEIGNNTAHAYSVLCEKAGKE